MRSRAEIEGSTLGKSGSTYYMTPTDKLILETLLDIRDLLENPPVVNSGQPMDDKAYRDLFNPKTNKP